ncbi:hypothetical protein FRE64_08250 [Euhalothece natronophila Z-M001]|uniref:Uncharacterized protein n=1 Tax=Euhalothece natronophila Z-M001 TaxID=522448 RepID=A0A5B8NLK5_9CHRO|nr:hypothetical protein [Euhalothece natronophila]QDZ39934.1 hypothetical protein FRE64_08250 [Euhalothece natronophila Z-M001]
MELKQFWENFGQGSIYYPQLAKKLGGVSATILYLTLWQWLTEQSKQQFSWEEIAEATGLSDTEQRLAKEELEARSLLKLTLISPENQIWSYELNLEQLEVILANDSSREPTTPTQSYSPPKNDPYFPPRRQSIAVKVTPHYQFSGPWNSQKQLDRFQDALLEYAKQQGHPNPGAWVFKIIDGISKGIKSPFWEEFIADIPLGESQKVQQEWEIEPGVPYPAFERERIQYYTNKGEPLESAVAKARSELRDPVKARDLWEGFLRKCDRVADEALKAKKMGVTNPYLPPSFSETSEVSKESVMAKLSQLEADTPLLEEDAPPEQTLGTEEKSPPEIPNLEDLQNLYNSPMTKHWVEEQIAKHPEWGYAIVDGKVVDQYPF